MGLMAGTTLAIGIGGMGELEFFRQCRMAGETDFTLSRLQQVGMVRGMRVVTTETLSLADRLMHRSLGVFRSFRSVAGITELAHLLLEKTAETGHVVTVAGAAVACGRRLMLHPLLECGTLMALETVDGRHGLPLSCKQQGQTRYQNQSNRKT